MKKLFHGAPVKGALIHGGLLLVVLIYGYRVWTKDTTASAVNNGSIVLWNKAESDLTAIEYAAPDKTVKLERRGDGANAYWWGVETKETAAPKPPAPPPTMAPPGPGSGAGSGSAAKPPTTPKPPGAGSAASQPKPPGAGSAAKPPTQPKPAAGSAAPKPAAGSAAPKPAAPKPAAGSAGPAKWGPGPGSGSAGSGSAGSGSAGSAAGSGSAGSGSAGSGSAGSATPFDPISGTPTPPEPPKVTTTREFPIGEGGDKVIKALTSARAITDLGKLSDEQKKEYKLDSTSITLSVVLKGGTRSFVIGGSVYGGKDKYALDTDSGKGYVLSGDWLGPLEQGETGMRLNDPRGFTADQVQKVTVSAKDKAKTGMRVMADAADTAKPDPANPHAPVPQGKTKTWGDPATGKPDQSLANFIDNADKLRPTKYEVDLDPKTLTEVVKLTYQDGKGSTLGTLALLKRDKPAEAGLPATTEYYIMTEKTRVPGLVPKGMAERVDNDIPVVFPP